MGQQIRAVFLDFLRGTAHPAQA